MVEAGRAELDAALERAQAVRMRATGDLAATVIRAPFDGLVGNLSVSRGDFVTPGKRLMAVVPLTAVHIEANFKETQLADMTPGTPAHLVVDAFPDREVIGRVETIAPASGSVFSLPPPENATGNFTKAVQRAPVRISVTADIAAQGWLRPRLSGRAAAAERPPPDRVLRAGVRDVHGDPRHSGRVVLLVRDPGRTVRQRQ